MTATSNSLDNYTLDARYERKHGRVFLTGTQALVRLPMMQRQLDRQAGLNTAGFISGYRGSPLGGYDQALWQAQDLLDQHDIHFQPGVNEDLAAAAVQGSQQVENDPHRTVDGVFSIWYGKGPGVDRSGDALRHGNATGSSPHGGVLVVAGDDHGAVSSSMPHQSDVAFLTWMMPVLNPASVAEYLEFGLYGFALSRFSGTWVGFKAISETVESGVSVELPHLKPYNIPTDFTPPAGGLHQQFPELPGPALEARLEAKIDAVRAFVRANPIDRAIFSIENARFGIITTGKGHHDVMEALRLLGIDEARARDLGIDIYKVGMVWPLDVDGIVRFLEGKREFLVVEEKRGIIESELKESFYDYSGSKPTYMVGKYDENGKPLIPWTGELNPNLLAPIIAARLHQVYENLDFSDRLAHITHAQQTIAQPKGVNRLPYFCPGCPHSTSTCVPEGSQAQTGIGCHVMAAWMGRDTVGSLFAMGSEGVNWVGRAPFNGNRHIFQNIGEGTYFHSGLLAIRQALASGANITYKILYNDAVAMTGGQPVDGDLSVAQIAQQVRAEGVLRIALLSDSPRKYFGDRELPTGITIHHRDELDTVQRELREIKGTSVLIFEQTCATEKRRRRKRGLMAKPVERVFINDLVCEGCGDCTVQSNCLAVVPDDTVFGRKKRIDQSTCNTDLSCLKGLCPSLVTISGGELRKPEPVGRETNLAGKVTALPEPQQTTLTEPFDLLVSGVGGTGVVTVGALITMAAHLEGKGASVLDFMGFAQKGGAVLSYVRLAAAPDELHQVRIDDSMADALIGCDLVVSTSQKALNVLRPNHTRAVLNTAEVQTGDYLRNPLANVRTDDRTELLRNALGNERVSSFDASALAAALMGDTVFANVMTLGFAWQSGLVPVSLAALDRAIELNNVAIEANRQAFAWGRLAAVDMAFVAQASGLGGGDAQTESFEKMVSRRADYLFDYQDERLADRYRNLVQRVATIENQRLGASNQISTAVARNYFKLLAHKDAFEVARLYTDTDFADKVASQFSGNYRINYHLAPTSLRDDADAPRPIKRRFGPWAKPLLGLLARMRVLRGTGLDPFARAPETLAAKALCTHYEEAVENALDQLSPQHAGGVLQVAQAVDGVQGFGTIRMQKMAEADAALKAAISALNSPDTTAIAA
jgi:indolepyruvate ferredoxin oxidoreductase